VAVVLFFLFIVDENYAHAIKNGQTRNIYLWKDRYSSLCTRHWTVRYDVLHGCRDCTSVPGLSWQSVVGVRTLLVIFLVKELWMVVVVDESSRFKGFW